ncbi:MAG: porin family protein [Flavobacteriales bacterium]
MRYVFLALVCMISAQLSAQEGASSRRNFTGGLVAGGVTSQISGDGLGGWDKFGVTAGAWVSVPLSEQLSATMSMKFINKGSRTKLDTLTYNTFGYYLNYVEVPIWFSYSVSRKEPGKMVVNLGPYAGYLFNQKIVSNGYDYSVNPPFEQIDIGIEAGVSFWITPKFSVNFMTSTSVLPTRPNPAQVNPLSYYEKGNYNQTLQLTFCKGFGERASVKAPGARAF